MKHLFGLKSILYGGALAALAVQPGMAASSTITGVQVNQTDSGLEVVLATAGGEAGNVFTVQQGNTLRADITRTQLNLPNGGEFRQENPAPGIAEIAVVPLDANSVRLIIEGSSEVPSGEIRSSSGAVVIAVQNGVSAAQAETVIPAEIETVPGPATPAPAQLAQAAPAAPGPATPGPAQNQAAPNVLVPNPEVTIDGVPVPSPQVLQAPPFLPRAVAPPVGDIAIAESAV
ncbi:MAG TPA: AMIN domain-containing protein, partial [Trichocoleus sp.]